MKEVKKNLKKNILSYLPYPAISHDPSYCTDLGGCAQIDNI